jgi:hypothetical protein
VTFNKMTQKTRLPKKEKKPQKRIGLAKGKFEVPYRIDESNDHIAQLLMYEPDDGPLTAQELDAVRTAAASQLPAGNVLRRRALAYLELNAIADARQGRPEVAVSLDDLMAEIPAGIEFEEWDVGPPVGKEIVEKPVFLSERDGMAIAKAIGNPPSPSKKLKAAIVRARKMVKKYE